MERQQGDSVYRYSSYDGEELLWFDFSRTPGDTINHNPQIVLSAVRCDTLFGAARRSYHFHISNPDSTIIDDDENWIVTDGLGVTDYSMASGAWQIRGARVGDIVYGTLVHVDASPHQHLGITTSILAYPNPFNGQIALALTCPLTSTYTIRILNDLGQVVQTLAHGVFQKGNHRLSWDGGAMPSGAYFVQVMTSSGTSTVRVVLVR
jgi:hypothetical protein